MKELRSRMLFAMMVVIATILSFVSCDGKYDEMIYVKGDRVEIIKGDSIYVRDTAYVEKIIEIITDKTERFICYDFKKNGNILGHVMNHAYTREFSYNFQMEAEKEVFFKTELEAGKASFKVTSTTTFDEKSMAFLDVNNGAEEISVPVMVPGSHSVKIDSEDLFPCNEFTLTAEVKKEEKTKVIKEKEYEVAVVTYKFLNGLGEEVKSSKMTLYSPIKEINERTIDLSYEVIENEVVITGKIENTIDPDTTIVTKVPLELSLKCEAKKTVEGTDFDFEAKGDPSDTSKNVTKKITIKKDSLTVAYNEIEGAYTHNVKASGNTVTVKQTARYYNEFVATLYGKTLEINLPVEVKTSGYEKVSANETVTEKSQLYNVNYTASQSSLTASAKQEVEIVIAKSSFESETVLFASRTVTFDKLQSPKVYDCVVTSVSTGGNNFKYREVYADGSKSAWTSEALSSANFKFIEDGLKNSNAALAIYNHKNVDGLRVGYLRDFLSMANQIIYFAYGCPQSTFDAINATMFGKLETCILGSATAENGVIEMTCSAGYYNDKLISPEETITLY